MKREIRIVVGFVVGFVAIVGLLFAAERPATWAVKMERTELR